MTPDELTRAVRALRENHEMEKTAGVLGKAKDVVMAVQEGASHAGNKLIDKGMPISGTAVKALPIATALYGGKRVAESDPVQRLRYKVRLWKAQRAARKAQRGYY